MIGSHSVVAKETKSFLERAFLMERNVLLRSLLKVSNIAKVFLMKDISLLLTSSWRRPRILVTFTAQWTSYYC